MSSAIIIDDEERGREALSNLITEFIDGVEIIAFADSVKTGLDAIHNYPCDLLFLDIELKDRTGFELLEQVADIDFEIIFVTAHEQYAIRAIKFCALDFLVKPVDLEELQEALQKIEKREDKNKRGDINLLLQNLNKGNNYLKSVALPTLDQMILMHLARQPRPLIGIGQHVEFAKEKRGAESSAPLPISILCSFSCHK